jgi:hypothetical protein
MKTRKFVVVALFVLVLMSAQVMAASCLNEIQSKKTSDFMNEIPALSSKLTTCDSKTPFFKNEIISVQILMQDGTKQAFALTLQDKKLVKIENGAVDKPTYTMSIGECEFDTFLRSYDKGGVFAYLYLQKKVQLSATGFFKKMKLAVIKIGMNIALKKTQTPADISCTTA